MSILRTMGECPVRLCAYVYPDAGGNGDYGHLFNKGLITQGLARTATLPAPAVESSSEGWSKSGRRRTPDLEIPAPLWNGNDRRRSRGWPRRIGGFLCRRSHSEDAFEDAHLWLRARS